MDGEGKMRRSGYLKSKQKSNTLKFKVIFVVTEKNLVDDEVPVK